MVDTSEDAVRETLGVCRHVLNEIHHSLERVGLEDLLALVEGYIPSQRMLLSWLLLGKGLGSLVLPVSARVPRVEELTAFLRLVRQERPELMALASELVRGSELASAVMVEIHLDVLAEAEGWNHPVEILERPRSDYRAMLAACRRRLRESEGPERRRLVYARRRLEIAVRIADNARGRRRRMKKTARSKVKKTGDSNGGSTSQA